MREAERIGVHAAARAQAYLNPGNGSVSRLCHEPRVALAALTKMLAPHVAGKRVQILLNHHAVREPIFRDNEDREHFLETSGVVFAKTGWRHAPLNFKS